MRNSNDFRLLNSLRKSHWIYFYIHMGMCEPEVDDTNFFPDFICGIFKFEWTTENRVDK